MPKGLKDPVRQQWWQTITLEPVNIMSSMSHAQILYPAIAMFALTMACVFALGLARRRAIRRGA